MKKYISLLSILALAGCMGGGSNGTGPVAGRPALISQDAIASNRELTDMASQILVATHNDAPTIVRAGSVTHDGTEYTSYDLGDVVLKTAAFADDFTQVNQMATLTFTLTDGEIDGIFIDEPQAWGANGIQLTRDTNNKFSGSGVFGGEMAVALSDAGYKSIAKASGEGDVLTRTAMGLRYSDFGILEAQSQYNDPDAGAVDEHIELFFAGGYNIDDKLIDMHTNPQNVSFTNGRAVGEVNLGHDGTDGVKSLYTDTATLTFDTENKNATISLPFYFRADDGTVTSDRWYTVNATINSAFNANNPNTNITSLTFTGGDNIPAAYSEYRFSDAASYTALNNIIVEPGGSGAVIRDGFINYYGDNGIPTEAVGNMRYMEENSDIIHNRIGFETAFGFGGTAQE